MAITASIAIVTSPIAPNQQATVQLTVSNSGGLAVQVTGVTPYASFSGTTPPQTTASVTFGQPPIGPAQTTIVPAAGSITISYPVTAFDSTNILPWLPITSYGPGSLVVNGGKVYQSKTTAQATSGNYPGPTGTGATITDGGVTWTYCDPAATSGNPGYGLGLGYDVGADVQCSDGSFVVATTAALAVIPTGR